MLVLQKYCRGWRVRRWFQIERAAVLIQSYFRGWKVYTSTISVYVVRIVSYRATSGAGRYIHLQYPCIVRIVSYRATSGAGRYIHLQYPCIVRIVSYRATSGAGRYIHLQ